VIPTPCHARGVPVDAVSLRARLESIYIPRSTANFGVNATRAESLGSPCWSATYRRLGRDRWRVSEPPRWRSVTNSGRIVEGGAEALRYVEPVMMRPSHAHSSVPEPVLSVIIPTLNEEESLGRLLADLRGLTIHHEVVVADGGSSDATRTVAGEAGAMVLTCERGRGTQLGVGARAASGTVFCFLHADVRLDPRAVRLISDTARTIDGAAYTFKLKIDSRRWAFRVIETGTNARTRWFRLPFGDQGLVIRRGDYDRAGGYPPIPLMEDVALARALRRIVPIETLPSSISVSPRRWERDGAIGRTFRNSILLFRYLLGADPTVLADSYRPERAGL